MFVSNGVYSRIHCILCPRICHRSPDLNSVDYQVWVLMQERVYKTYVCNTSDLKQHLTGTWTSISQNITDEAVDQNQCMWEGEVNHSEHLLN